MFIGRIIGKVNIMPIYYAFIGTSLVGLHVLNNPIQWQKNDDNIDIVI